MDGTTPTASAGAGPIDGACWSRRFIAPRPNLVAAAAAEIVALAERAASPAAEGTQEPGAADATFDRAVDLSAWIVVVPGSRAGRLILRELARAARAARRPFEAPMLATVGTLVERAVEFGAAASDGGGSAAGMPVAASPLERRLAWERALAAAEPEVVSPLVPTTRRDDPAVFRRLAETAVRLEDDLASADVSIETAIAAIERRGGDPARLGVLAACRAAAAAFLGDAGLACPWEVRRAAIERGGLLVDRAILVGTLELAAPQRALLRRFARVVALVPGRPEAADRFDEFGAALPAWDRAPLHVPSERIRTAESPRDVAEVGLRFVARQGRHGVGRDGRRIAADEVTIGLADDALAEPLVLAGADAGVDVHVAAGAPLASMPVGRLLAALERYRRTRAPADAAALLRRPAMAAYVERRLPASGEDDEPADVVAALDEVRATRLPATLDQPLGAGPGATIELAVAEIDRWMADAARPGGLAAMLDALRPARRDDVPSDARSASDAAFERVRALAAAIESIHPTLRGESDPVTLLCEECRRVRLPGEPRERAIEALGWLELLFDPAPHVAVLGVNEGAVPGGAANDTLLPESVRESLGMPCRATRARRDAALLDALLQRDEPPLLVVGRRSAEGDPLLPSRLLLRDRGEALARRVRDLSDRRKALAGDRAWRRAASGPSLFTVPAPGPEARTITSMSATGFRAYLASGMRFWLERIEHLAEVHDDPHEIPVPDLGELLHETLRILPERDLDLETDDRSLLRALRARFRSLVAERFGERPLPAVRLQAAVMEERLGPFARWQAARAAEGWRVRMVEVALPGGFEVVAPGAAPMGIRGRVDRVDFHAGSRRWRIVDYKTGDAGRTPRETHLVARGKEWADLQLPLYLVGMRETLGNAEPGSTAEIGYVRLPADPAMTGWCAADFTVDELDDAMEAARRVVAAIRAGAFPTGEPLGAEDPFEAILQRTVFGRDDDDGEDDGEEDAP